MLLDLAAEVTPIPSGGKNPTAPVVYVGFMLFIVHPLWANSAIQLPWEARTIEAPDVINVLVRRRVPTA